MFRLLFCVCLLGTWLFGSGAFRPFENCLLLLALIVLVDAILDLLSKFSLDAADIVEHGLMLRATPLAGLALRDR